MKKFLITTLLLTSIFTTTVLAVDTDTSWFNKNVKISIQNEMAIDENGNKINLYGKPFIDKSNNYMVPVRGLAYALGLSEDDVKFNSETGEATFIVRDLGKITVQAGNSYATVNGVKTPLIDAKGNTTSPIINNGRFYLPLRACATGLFGVDIKFNSFDNSVILNTTNEDIISETTNNTTKVEEPTKNTTTNSKSKIDMSTFVPAENEYEFISIVFTPKEVKEMLEVEGYNDNFIKAYIQNCFPDFDLTTIYGK